MRLATFEQGREQPAEMAVDLSIGGEQPDAAFAVEIADRAAQAMDRLSQLLGFLGALGTGGVELGQLLLGNQAYGPDPLALGYQPFERPRFFVWIAMPFIVDAKLLPQSPRHAVA